MQLCFSLPLLLLLNLPSNKLGVVAESQAATPPLNQPRGPTPPCDVIYEPGRDVLLPVGRWPGERRGVPGHHGD